MAVLRKTTPVNTANLGAMSFSKFRFILFFSSAYPIILTGIKSQ
jgi:hypothetical protein